MDRPFISNTALITRTDLPGPLFFNIAPYNPSVELKDKELYLYGLHLGKVDSVYCDPSYVTFLYGVRYLTFHPDGTFDHGWAV